MKILWLLLLLMVTCKGCQTGFKNNHGLNRHRPTCNPAKNRAAVHIRSRHQQRKGLLRRLSELSVDPKLLEEGSPNGDISALMDVDHLGALKAMESTGSEEPNEDLFIPPPTRSGRQRKFPRTFKDFVPNNTTTVPHMPPKRPAAETVQVDSSPPADTQPAPSSTPIPLRQLVRTAPDEFGIYREYLRYPSSLTGDEIDLDDRCDAPGLATIPRPQQRRWWSGFGRNMPELSLDSISNNVFAPFLNATVFRLMNWFYSGSSTKSISELQSLVDDVLLAPNFSLADLESFNARKELKRLDGNGTRSNNPGFQAENGWKHSSVKVKLPAENVKSPEASAPMLEIPGVYHRSLVEAITTAVQEEEAKAFVFTPFSLFWKPTPSSEPQRLFSETYNSDAFLKEHERVMELPPEPGPEYERAIVALQFWSDSTSLAQFGSASLWPLYGFFGNQSKYKRAKPTEFAAHHIAYIPSLPDTFQDDYAAIFGQAASANTTTHLKRELMHAVWELLLDEEFIKAYKHGIVVKCADDITRRLYPRIFTYSADYPEKVLLATIRYLANCPCPICFTKKEHISALGTKVDDQRRAHLRSDTFSWRRTISRAREFIFDLGKGVVSAAVNGLLQEDSWIPTRNAFSVKLEPLGFDLFTMFVPDLLHEFELGVWKAIFSHLVRILYAAGDSSIRKLNWRYRHVPTFGRGTIRRFHENAAAMKKLAGRDFEDLLQCSLPVFEDLLPRPHNEIVLDLLFALCEWHAYAKLRLHTDTTLQALASATKMLGRQIRQWVAKTCSIFDTRELPKEEGARHRRKAAASSNGKSIPRGSTAGRRGRGRRGRGRRGSNQAGAQPRETPDAHQNKLRKLFSMCTYKLHSLGHYVAAIAMFGTTDSYSTQVGELEHRRVKRFYARTNKRKSFTRQIANQQRRERILKRIRDRLQQTDKDTLQPSSSQPPAPKRGLEAIQSPLPSVPFEESDPLPKTLPEVRYHISNSTRQKENIFRWVDHHEEKDDDAITNFVPKLKDHILTRLAGNDSHGDTLFTEEDHNSLQFDRNLIYRHKTLRVNYTTYDLRREQDSINPRSHHDVMLLAPREHDGIGEPHPYLYARVIGIFHVNVTHSGLEDKTRIDFLWVRYLERDTSYKAGWNARRLHRVSFLNSKETDAFGFLDPSVIIRGIHLIPGFAHGETQDLLSPSQSVARMPLNTNCDWRYYYVNMFVDRDMVMRYLGGGVGHKAFHDAMPAVRTEPSTIDDNFITEENLIEDEEEAQLAEEEDYGYNIQSENEDEDPPSDDDLGPEDGEEPWEVGDLEAEGYDDL